MKTKSNEILNKDESPYFKKEIESIDDQKITNSLNMMDLPDDDEIEHNPYVLSYT